MYSSDPNIASRSQPLAGKPAASGLTWHRIPWPHVISALLLFLALVTVHMIYRLAGLNHAYLSEYIDLDAFFDVPAVILRCALGAIVVIYLHALGEQIAAWARLKVSWGVIIGLGIMGFHIVIIPLFFLHLMSRQILLALFFILSLLLARHIHAALCGVRNLLRFWPWPAWIMILLVAMMFIEAVLPVTFSESLGDVADAYLRLPMLFAASHGSCFSLDYAGPLSSYPNWEIVTSALVVLSNPEIVKLMGWIVFVVLIRLVYECTREFCSSFVSMLAPFAFLVSSIWWNSDWFSFAHPRIYFLFLSFLAICLVLLGSARKQPKFHYIALIVLGLLAGTTLAGMIVCLASIVFMFLFNAWRIRPYPYILSVLVFCVLAAMFPVWYFVNAGSPFPTNMPLNQLFSLTINPDVYNQYLWERFSVMMQQGASTNWFDYILFPIRFQWMVIAPYSVLLVMIINKVAETVEAWSLNGRIPAGIISHKASRICFSAIVALALVSSTWAAFENTGGTRIKQAAQFITGRKTLAEYLGRPALIARYLNQNFKASDRILYFFSEQGIYARPALCQPTKMGAASVVYRSDDPVVIMEKLKSLGINYLFFDNCFGRITDNNPGLPIVADITTPIFEPQFFSRYFEPIPCPLANMYVFRIMYDGLDKEAEEINYSGICHTGFFMLLYGSLKNAANPLVISANPYTTNSLLQAFGNLPMDRFQQIDPFHFGNIALAGTASASSVISGYVKHTVRGLNDGILGNDYSWIPLTNGRREWAQIDLGKAAEIRSVSLGRDFYRRHADRLPLEFNIMISLDGKKWRSFHIVRRSLNPGLVEYLVGEQKGRYVKVEVLRTSANDQPCIDEIIVRSSPFGEKLAGYFRIERFDATGADVNNTSVIYKTPSGNGRGN